MQEEIDEFIRVEQGSYTLLLQQEMSENLGETIYFSLPDQEGFLYEYEGELDQALSDLPEIYNSVETEAIQGEQNPVLSSQAAAVIEQLWNYFDLTGEQKLEGEHDYDFQVEGDQLLVLPKDTSGEVVAIDREGVVVESAFEPERYEHLMERFAIAYSQMQVTEYQRNEDQDREL